MIPRFAGRGSTRASRRARRKRTTSIGRTKTIKFLSNAHSHACSFVAFATAFFLLFFGFSLCCWCCSAVPVSFSAMHCGTPGQEKFYLPPDASRWLTVGSIFCFFFLRHEWATHCRFNELWRVWNTVLNCSTFTLARAQVPLFRPVNEVSNLVVKERKKSTLLPTAACFTELILASSCGHTNKVVLALKLL